MARGRRLSFGQMSFEGVQEGVDAFDMAGMVTLELNDRRPRQALAQDVRHPFQPVAVTVPLKSSVGQDTPVRSSTERAG